ncbi:MAG: response regulator [Candidatus Latescibacteria bacterium]|nr:response regulator [Candidatus Latescibacterota bacterium]
MSSTTRDFLLSADSAAVEYRLREEVWKMQHSEDMAGVMQALVSGLRTLGLEFDACGVNIVEPAGDDWQVRYYEAIQSDDGVIDQAGLANESNGLHVVVDIWREGAVAYRSDLDAEDRYGERPWMDDLGGIRTRSVVDVPFAHGTLALASEKPDAFPPADRAVLVRMAAVLAEGFSRREDLRRLEREIEERQRAEEETRINLAVQQVRNAVLQMQREKGWGEVLAVLNAQLAALVDYYLCGIQLIDELKNTYQAQDVTPPVAGKLTLNETLPRALKKAVETGRPVYRRNRTEIENYADLIGREVQSVVDAPFRGGTIAINSKREGAFSERDIHILERFAQVMSEAHLRLQDLIKLREREEQLRQAQKMEAIGQLTAGIAHNFNNALAGATVNLYLARRQASPEISRLLVETERAIGQASDMVRKLMTYSRRERETEFGPLDLAPLLENVGSICRKTFDRRIAIAIEVDPALAPVSGDANQLEQTLLNLCLNARDALAGINEPTIRIAAHCVGAPETGTAGAQVMMAVSDNGTGMDEETRVQVFDPFFTTKGVDAGTGLGLSMVYGTVQQHGGRIECESVLGEGTTFAIYLPVARDGAVEASARGAEEVPTGAETVLLIDDEEQIRRSMARLLESSGYQVLLAADGIEGLDIYRRQPGGIDVVILDMSMPRMSGQEVLANLQRINPEVKVLIFSGYAPEDDEVYARVMGVVEKPPASDMFLKQVREIIDVKAR